MLKKLLILFSGRGGSSVANERMYQSAKDRQWAERLREAMFTWINAIQDTHGGLPEVQFNAMQKIAERRLIELAMCILVEATLEEKERMWPDGSLITIP
jgi:hypothetical protein